MAIPVSTRLLTAFICLAALLTAFAPAAAGPGLVIGGSVADQHGLPVPGASVVLLSDTSTVTGGSTDLKGSFRFRIASFPESGLVLRASSIGYETRWLALDPIADSAHITVTLAERMIRIGKITVRPGRSDDPPSIVSYPRPVIEQALTRSVVPGNPTATIKEPQVARLGSSHSSQIRVHGTSPRYFLNGGAIGFDPDHYGMFSLIPGAVLEQITFEPHGSNASYSSPSIIEFSSRSPFGKPFAGELDISTIAATGTFSLGNERTFLLGSLRKSVLDKLVRQFEATSDRQTIPPTNFEDVYVSYGLRLGNNTTVSVDQFHVRDYLSYHVNESTMMVSTDVAASQHTTEDLLAVHVKSLVGPVLLRGTGSWKSSAEEYAARPSRAMRNVGVTLDLSEKRRTYFGRLDAAWQNGPMMIEAGVSVDQLAYRSIDLQQRNWNFLPPLSTSDNPYIYQNELNQLYAAYNGVSRETNAAAFVSAEREFSSFRLRSGLRLDHFSMLKERQAPTMRHRLTVPLQDNTTAELFYGTFAESPVTTILDPYQVLIHDNLSNLEPVRTRLLSLTVQHNGLRVGLFRKYVRDIPVLTPDFSQVDDYGSAVDGFITVQPTGRADYWGMSLSMMAQKIGGSNFDLTAHYAYTYGETNQHGVGIADPNNAPHRLYARGNYRVSPRLSLGSELEVRSGYAYTPYATYGAPFSYRPSVRYTDSYFKQELSEEYEERFAATAYLNLYGELNLGNTEVYLSLANVTNRANPIINTASGYIYDTGILPTLGVKYRF